MMHGTHNVTLTHCNMMDGTHNVALTHCNMMHSTHNVQLTKNEVILQQCASVCLYFGVCLRLCKYVYSNVSSCLVWYLRKECMSQFVYSKILRHIFTEKYEPKMCLSITLFGFMFFHRALSYNYKYKRRKCTFSELIFQFLVFDVFYMFRSRRFILWRRLYVQLWYWYGLHASI